MTTAVTTSGAASPDGKGDSVGKLQGLLRAMRLSAVAEELPDLLDEAARDEWGRLELLQELFEREAVRKRQRRFERDLAASGISECYALENFDYRLAAARGVDPGVVRDLASCEFVRRRRNLMLVGSVGTGKTYLARTLGFEALKHGYKVLSFNTVDLAETLYSKRTSFQFGKFYGRIRDAELLVLDDLAYMPYSAEKAELLFSLVVDRYELGRGCTIATSNTDVTEWWQYFPSKAMGMAFSDRLIDGAQGIRLQGPSIRQERSKYTPPGDANDSEEKEPADD